MERGIITISETGVVAMPTASVWMTQQEMSDLFMVFCCDIHKAIRDIYKNHELVEETTMCYIRQEDGTRYEVYSLEMVMALAFRLRSRECMAFREFVIERLYAPNRKKPPSFVLFAIRSQSTIQVLVPFVSIMIIMQEADGWAVYLSTSASSHFTLCRD